MMGHDVFTYLTLIILILVFLSLISKSTKMAPLYGLTINLI